MDFFMVFMKLYDQKIIIKSFLIVLNEYFGHFALGLQDMLLCLNKDHVKLFDFLLLLKY